MKQKKVKKIIAVIIIALFCAGLLAFAAVSPETKLGYSLFRCVYATPISKQYLLDSYRADLWLCEGGYIPTDTDKFLCSRLEESSSDEEITAITNFYRLQANGRETMHLISISDEAKQKIIGSIMQNLDSYDEWHAGQALFLVEELRSGKFIGKGSFAPTNPKEANNWNGWWEKRGLSKIKSLYRKWWNAQTPWSVKKSQNPLAGSGIEIHGL